jgi:hypothetical protein
MANLGFRLQPPRNCRLLKTKPQGLKPYVLLSLFRHDTQRVPGRALTFAAASSPNAILQEALRFQIERDALSTRNSRTLKAPLLAKLIP